MKTYFKVSLVPAFFFFIVLPAFAQQDLRMAPECKYCGMYRSVFAYSRMLVERNGKKPVGTCSLNCTAVDYMHNLDSLPKTIKVGDYKSRRLIDAKTACWVIGGDKRGVMTERAKWAFKSKKDAQKFIAKHGGNLATFEQAFKASCEDLYKDMNLSNRHRFLQHAHVHHAD